MPQEPARKIDAGLPTRLSESGNRQLFSCTNTSKLRFPRRYNFLRVIVRKKGLNRLILCCICLAWGLCCCNMMFAQHDYRFSNLRSRVVDVRLAVQALDSLTVAFPLAGVADAETARLIPLSYFSVQNNLLHTDTAGLITATPGAGTLFPQPRLADGPLMDERVLTRSCKTRFV